MATISITETSQGKSIELIVRGETADQYRPDIAPVTKGLLNRINAVAAAFDHDGAGVAIDLPALRSIAERFVSSHLLDWADLASLETLEAGHGLNDSNEDTGRGPYDGKYFRVWREKAGDGQLDHIMIAAVPRADEIPQKYLDFKITVDRANNVIAILHGQRRSSRPSAVSLRCIDYHDTLFQLTAVGLGQDQVKLASMALAQLEADVVDRESGTIKNGYLMNLGLTVLAFAVLVLGTYVGIRSLDYLAREAKSVFQLRSFLPLVAGAALGAWLSFAIRKTGMTFRSLAVLEEDRLEPVFRIAFVVGLSTVVGLLFWTETIVISIGKFTTNFKDSGTTALLIGLLCGIGELGLASNVSGRATDFVARIGASNRSES